MNEFEQCIDEWATLCREKDAQITTLTAALDAEREKHHEYQVFAVGKVAEYEAAKQALLEVGIPEQHEIEGQLVGLGLYGRIKDLVAQLSQLQALVRALPDCVPTSLQIFEAADGNGFDVHGAIKEPYSVGWIGTFLHRTETESYIALLKYRATLDATTPAKGERHG